VIKRNYKSTPGPKKYYLMQKHFEKQHLQQKGVREQVFAAYATILILSSKPFHPTEKQQ